MATFVKLQTIEGDERIVNVDAIRHIIDRTEGGSTIVFIDGDSYGIMEQGADVAKKAATVAWK